MDITYAMWRCVLASFDVSSGTKGPSVYQKNAPQTANHLPPAWTVVIAFAGYITSCFLSQTWTLPPASWRKNLDSSNQTTFSHPSSIQCCRLLAHKRRFFRFFSEIKGTLVGCRLLKPIPFNIRFVERMDMLYDNLELYCAQICCVVRNAR